jgi:hypothetical protein
MTPRTRMRVDPPAQRTVYLRLISYRIPLALVGGEFPIVLKANTPEELAFL